MFLQFCRKCNRLGRITDNEMSTKGRYVVKMSDGRLKQLWHDDRCFPNTSPTYESLPIRFIIIESQ